MKSFLLSAFICLISVQMSFGQWEPINTNINDDFTGVVFLDNNGLVSGHNGLYYTTNYGANASDWTRFEITTNSGDSDIYESTVFSHCYANDETAINSGFVYASGVNTLTNSAVIFRINFPSLDYDIIYNGAANTRINKIGFKEASDTYYAVGDNGLIVGFTDASPTSFIINPSSTDFNNEDFNAVSFNSNRLWLGTDGKIFYGNHYGTDNYINLSAYDTPGVNHVGLDFRSTYNMYSAGNNYSRFSISTGITYNNRFDFGDLNAQTMINSSNQHLIGTDHGIFKSTTSNNYLEWQPSSSTYSIKSFWDDPNDPSLIYACGDNGVLLKTTNLGGATKPYISLDAIGRCVGSSVNFDFFNGSSNSCSWTLDGTEFNTGCSDFNYTFNTVGSYDIVVTAENSFGEQSTLSTTIHIVNPPETNKPTTVSDNLLCKEESIEIQIENSEPNVRYVLKMVGESNTYGTSPIGNGGTITLVSAPINTAGDYYLRAEHVLANCYQNFSDQFTIDVEHTEAIYFQSLINAKQNEVVEFNNYSVDAQNFSWEFSPSASPLNSSMENPEVTFSNLGETTVNFECWSDNGCYDEVEKPGPYIYESPVGQTSWTILNDGVDPQWSGYYYDDIADIEKTQDGFLACGYYNENQTMDSNVGTTFTFEEGDKGCYLTKYDEDGALKWLVKVQSNYISYDDRDSMYATVEDQLGNIYVCGASEGTFYDTLGNAIPLSGSSANESFLIKLNSKGEFQWYVHGAFAAKRLFIDQDNNLVATGLIANSGQIFLNGVEIHIATENPEGDSRNNAIVKFAPDGSVIWDTAFYNQNTNGGEITHIGFDSNNNYYISGYFEILIDLYSVNNPVPETLWREFNNYGAKLFLTKFDENGQLIWKLRSYTDTEYTDGTRARSMVTDENGNCYISGSNAVNNSFIAMDDNHIFENTDGTTTSMNAGEYFVAKIDTNGVCQWIQGAENTYYGYGYKIIKNNDEICVLGKVSNNGEAMSTSEFTSSDNINYNLTISADDYFISMYDEDGVLLRLISNGSNNGNTIRHSGKIDFFKGEGDYYFSSMNIWFFNGANDFETFGMVIPQVEGETEGLITRFTEEDGIVHYRNSLSIDDYETSKFMVYPNPAQTVVFIKTDVPINKVSVYSIQGQKVFESSRSNINVEHLSSGLYFIKIEGANNTEEVKQFIKE
ncbi:T9SS type A sorting domain-containing protein [Psychroserpens mesophilus]|uniref:T9SS type A sorting domain-containing protein n=1 Tax=Psychroserpens mesophilus TaxID=325473 RepID=UPI0009FF3E76|nr:T9SS type A sorting domain-containing protein [Psychroserpens mesophilus]